MIRISILTKIFQAYPLREAFASASKNMCDGIEIMCWKPHLTFDASGETVREIRNLAGKFGVDICCLSTYTGGYSTSGEPEKQFEEFKAFANMARLLDCKLIRTWPGGPSPRIATVEQLKKGVYWTQRCADYAAQNGLMVVVEVHFDELIEDANSCLEFIAKVGRENVKLIYDAGNMFVAEVDFGPESLRNIIEHVHMKDLTNRPEATHNLQNLKFLISSESSLMHACIQVLSRVCTNSRLRVTSSVGSWCSGSCSMLTALS